MAKKKAIAKKSAKKKSVKKLTKKVTKKVAKKKTVKAAPKKTTPPKANTGLPSQKVFADMMAHIALLTNRVERLLEVLKVSDGQVTITLPSRETIEAPHGTVEIAAEIQDDMFDTNEELSHDHKQADKRDWTKDQVTEALQKISTEKGLPVVKTLLADFDAQRVSDIPEINYPAFMIEVQNIMNTVSA